MSLLLDALKKAEEAKRRREAGLAGTVLASPDTAPAVTEPAVMPTAAAAPAGIPDGELTLTPVEPRLVEPEPQSAEAVDPGELALPTLELEVAEASPADAQPEDVIAAEPEAIAVMAAPPTEPEPPAEPAPAPVPISQPEPEPVAPPAPTPRPAPEPSPVATPAITLETRRESPMQLSPEATRQLFDSKQDGKSARARRQRIALLAGLCLAVAVAGGSWLWWQWQHAQQPGMLVNANPTDTVPVAEPATDAETSMASEPSAGTPPSPAGTAEQAAPTASQRVDVSTAEVGPVPPPRPALPVTPQAGDRARVVEIPANVAAPDVRFVRDAQEPGVPRTLQQAYDAFQQGDHARAAELYRQHLRQDSKSRDALLGLAAVAVQRQQLDEARNLYRRVLADNPRDDLAQSALTSLSTIGDPDAAEGKLRALMQSNPRHETATALANLLAGQSRWSEAQEFYFQAFSSAPDEPDYAYNLAIALDALGERKLAADHYRKALALSARKPSAFTAEAVQRRLSQLGGE